MNTIAPRTTIPVRRLPAVIGPGYDGPRDDRDGGGLRGGSAGIGRVCGADGKSGAEPSGAASRAGAGASIRTVSSDAGAR
jgi:hypothetical protein